MSGCTSARHGTLAAYRDGCRCPKAVVANNRAITRYRIRRLHRGRPLTTDPTAAARMLRGLACLGWSNPAIAARSGVSRAEIDRIILGEVAYIRLDIATAITRVYRAWSDTECTHPRSSQPRRRAREMNWLPPIAWDDDTIGDPWIDEERLRAQVMRADAHDATADREDRIERAAALLATGRTRKSIALELGCTTRTLERYIAEMREQVAS